MAQKRPRRPARLAPGLGRVDLRATVDGLVAGTFRAAPTVGAIDGGTALFYRGKVNGLAGESGGGKTWTGLHVAQQALDGGEAVVYIDHEDDAAGIVGRLLELGTDPNAIVDLFAYFNPTERPTVLDLAELGELVAELQPALVVVDSTGKGWPWKAPTRTPTKKWPRGSCASLGASQWSNTATSPALPLSCSTTSSSPGGRSVAHRLPTQAGSHHRGAIHAKHRQAVQP